MRKTLFIIAVGIFIGLFPLLAFPPHIEMWVLLFVGGTIVVFGLYEQIAGQEKQRHTNTPDSNPVHTEEEVEDIEIDEAGNMGEEVPEDENL